uniref:EH domain-containing protein n=1 Tax=Caenorhabditis tropicalis TaxID=1561998 RepID=A0A1I7UHP3_9PELO
MEGKFSMDSQILEEVIRSGNIPCHGRTGMLCAGGGLLPPALLDEARVPKFYLDALVSCGGTSSTALPNTGLVYNLMGTSGLPKDVLSHIWSAVNRAKPGQLTRPEFFSLLALLALAQKGESLAALCAMDSLPIPYLNPVQAFPTPSNPTPATNTTSSFVPFGKIKPSAFIPTSLLPRRSMRKKKESDSKETSVHNSPAKGAAQDLAGLDFSDISDIKEETKDANETPMRTCWRETVHAIYIVVEEANQLFKNVKKDVLLEILETEKGSDYFKSLSKAFNTLERVCKSAGVLLSIQSTKEAEYCRNLRRKWEPYLVENVESKSEDSVDERKCVICCQPAQNAIDYGGQCFDVTCANLWVNGVSSTLPSLHLK